MPPALTATASCSAPASHPNSRPPHRKLAVRASSGPQSRPRETSGRRSPGSPGSGPTPSGLDPPPLATPRHPRSFPELAHHLSDALGSGLPGAYPNGSPLFRLTDATLIEKNRDTACKKSYFRPPGKTCDEYPFASTREGAYTGGGSPRTLDWCQIPKVPQGITGTDGYSVCMIDATQNTNGGLALLSFYRDNRVLSWDAFHVWTPFNYQDPNLNP